MPQPRDRAFATGASVVVVVVLGLGFYYSGSPNMQRQYWIDRTRVERLQQIANQIYSINMEKKPLPANLDEIRSTYLRIGDPETDMPFEYHVKDGTRYELCANFAAESEDWKQNPNSRSHWAHPAGRYCYTLDAKLSPWAP